MQRRLERSIRKCKREITVREAAGDEEKLKIAQVRYTRLNQEYARFSKAAGLRTQTERLHTAGFDYKQGKKATEISASVEKVANLFYNIGTTEANVNKYLKNKAIHDLLDENHIGFVSQINEREFIVDAGAPIIKNPTIHALKNLQEKRSRENMTVETAQGFVDGAKLTLYQADRKTLKFLADSGYAVLNFENELVTAVPQKWREKYDKYLKKEV